MEKRGSPPAQIVKETIVTKEVVLIQCRHCGARYPQGTPKCFTCGANL
jgi:ribosomal protein L40E